MAKPGVHQIPLTPAERTFVVSVLDRAAKNAVEYRKPNPAGTFTDAMLVDEDRAGAIAAVVSRWPEEGGMVEIVMLDSDRQVTRRLLERDRARRRGDPRQSRRQLPLALDPYENDDHVFTIGKASLTGKEILNLMLAFGDYELDIMTARRILAQSSKNLACLEFFKIQRSGEPVMHAYLRNVALAGVYIDDESAQPPYYMNVHVTRNACAAWECAGLCKLRREPAGGRRKFDRVYLDWDEGMWLRPTGRRLPKPLSPRLTDEDDKALGEMVA